jgi:hypothetical protein
MAFADVMPMTIAAPIADRFVELKTIFTVPLHRQLEWPTGIESGY